MIFRLQSSNIQRVWNSGKSILLLGPRQTGKTTLAEQFEYDLHINFLSTRVRQAYERDPDLLIKEVLATRKSKSLRPLRVFIDEVQKVPDIMDPIQLLIDKKKAQFFITGSSARKLKQQSDLNLLPGRVISFRMDGFSSEEISPKQIEQALYYGSLPEIALNTNPQEKDELLQTYVEVYLEEEIRKEARLKKIPDFYHFLQHAAARSGLVCSYSKVSQEIGISHVTVKSYYEILESTMIADRIEPITTSKSRPKLIKSPRYIFFDLGVRRLAAREGIDQPQSSVGGLFEQWVGLEIQKFIRNHKSKASLHFWQDPGRAEVDWVIKKENTYIPIEVKMSSSPKESDAKHLIAFQKEYSCKLGSYIVSSGERNLELKSGVTVVPWKNLSQVLRKIL